MHINISKFVLAVGTTLLLVQCLYATEFSWPKEIRDQKERKIIDDRYAHASTNALGSTNDIAAIKHAIAADMKPQEVEVREIRWLSPSLVMAYTRTESAAYYYVSEKRKSTWEIRAHYGIWVK